MGANSYPTGQGVRIFVYFKDPNAGNAYVDPTTVTFKILSPAAASPTVYVYGVDPEVVKDATGQYHIDIVLSFPGDWHYRWEGTGAYSAAVEKRMHAQTTEF